MLNDPKDDIGLLFCIVAIVALCTACLAAWVLLIFEIAKRFTICN
jgi:hypothetical protein